MTGQIKNSWYTKPQVYSNIVSKSLVFSDFDVQSRMNIKRPFELQFEYTRLMAASVALVKKPKKILMIGMGGGSLVKFCHRHMPQTHITVVELNPFVLELRKDFLIPDDDDRLATVLQDASCFLSEAAEKFDLIFADGYDINGLPNSLCSLKFYSDCHRVLNSGGVLVSNLHYYSPNYDLYVSRIEKSFYQPTFLVNTSGAANSIVYCIKSPASKDEYRLECLDEDVFMLSVDGFKEIEKCIQRVRVSKFRKYRQTNLSRSI